MNTAKKLAVLLTAYAIIMRVLWDRLTESTQVKEVLLVLFAVSIVLYTIIFEMHKINKEVKEDEVENENKKN